VLQVLLGGMRPSPLFGRLDVPRVVPFDRTPELETALASTPEPGGPRKDLGSVGTAGPVPTFAQFIQRCADSYAGPTLAYDFGETRRRLCELREQSKQRPRQFLFAVKAFRDVRWLRSLVRESQGFLGFDIANEAELDLLLQSLGSDVPPLVSVTGPLAHTVAPRLSELPRGTGVIFNVDSEVQYRRIVPHLRGDTLLGARIALSATEEEAKAGDSLTRFGFDLRAPRALQAVVNDPHFAGLHCHLGARCATLDQRLDVANRLIAFAASLPRMPRYLNLGGGVRATPQDLSDWIRALESRTPTGTTLCFEPGAFWTDDAGVAICQVLDVKSLQQGGARVIVDLSADCHLRWSSPARIILLGTGEKDFGTERDTLIFFGPTCYEADLLGVYRIPRRHDGSCAVEPGALICFSGITSYAASWNASFNGIAPARVVIHAES
jgi:diaminopimelate decarboxylase